MKYVVKKRDRAWNRTQRTLGFWIDIGIQVSEANWTDQLVMYKEGEKLPQGEMFFEVGRKEPIGM